MLAIPIPERQLDALHRLLGHLCSAGDIAALVSLPLAGTLGSTPRLPASAVTPSQPSWSR